MQRRLFQDSMKDRLSLAVSTRAFNMGLPLNPFEKPQRMGKTVFLPERLGAITGTMSVGRTSPDSTITYASEHTYPEEDLISSKETVRRVLLINGTVYPIYRKSRLYPQSLQC